MTADEIARLRTVSVSQGIMLETASERLSRRGGPHFGSPDKHPAVRLATIRAAGEAAVPFTSGILIGIGETRAERVEALLALRDLHRRYGHLQEIIIQNFRAKPDTRMADAPEPALDEHLWTIAVARILFGPEMNIQAPPNLRAGSLQRLIAAGINDWGGVSPVTPDHVNPEHPWPQLDALAQRDRGGRQDAGAAPRGLSSLCAGQGPLDRRQAAHRRAARLRRRRLRPRRGLDAGRRRRAAGHAGDRPAARAAHALSSIARGPERSSARTTSSRCLAARGESFREVCAAADALRAETVGDRVSYVVTRNINYTNVCAYRCRFCAFSKGKLSENLRGRPYDLALDEIQRRCREAWERGAVEVCLQGGIHPDYTGATYLAICRAIKDATPDMHIHAFSPLEVSQGAATLGMTVEEFLAELKAAGLGSLPGTAAEVLDDEVRAVICPDKVNTAQWLDVVETAHRLGLRTTATIMFGHVDTPRHWARHLLHVRRLQARTGGFTEFVPLPFVPMETPIYLRGRSRSGPTFREAVLMHAVARLALHPLITNIQTSWVKMGREGAKACLPPAPTISAAR